MKVENGILKIETDQPEDIFVNDMWKFELFLSFVCLFFEFYHGSVYFKNLHYFLMNYASRLILKNWFSE